MTEMILKSVIIIQGIAFILVAGGIFNCKNSSNDEKMKKYKFKKGDKVVVVRTDEDDVKMGIKIGDTGEVLEDNNDLPWLRMDKYNEKFSDAGGRCESGHGWGLYEHQLELE